MKKEKTQVKVLFILKRRTSVEYGCNTYGYADGLSTGLLNSAMFVRDMLQGSGIDAALVVVNDNNDIDREVTAYRPTHVIIEALWVIPEKFRVLNKLHPKVQWIVRLHSEAPFIANEGMSIGWIFDYMNIPRVSVGVNSPRFKSDLSSVLWWEDRGKVLYMPNYYPTEDAKAVKHNDKSSTVDIGCFGAIRPLKNQLLQAMAAVKFADDINVKLRFHINLGRVEMKGTPALTNLSALFENNMHELVVHGWLDHSEFVKLAGEMDVCMQVSFSETFNIVTADAIVAGTPVVVSKEVPWAKVGFANPTDMDSMVRALKTAWQFRRTNVFLNQIGLCNYARKSKKAWLSRNLWGV